MSFGKSVIFGINYTLLQMSICIRNLVEIGTEMAEIHLFMYFGMIFPHFGPPTVSLLVGYIYPANSVMIRSDLADILRF